MSQDFSQLETTRKRWGITEESLSIQWEGLCTYIPMIFSNFSNLGILLFHDENLTVIDRLCWHGWVVLVFFKLHHITNLLHYFFEWIQFIKDIVRQFIQYLLDVGEGGEGYRSEYDVVSVTKEVWVIWDAQLYNRNCVVVLCIRCYQNQSNLLWTVWHSGMSINLLSCYTKHIYHIG